MWTESGKLLNNLLYTQKPTVLNLFWSVLALISPTGTGGAFAGTAAGCPAAMRQPFSFSVF